LPAKWASRAKGAPADYTFTARLLSFAERYRANGIWSLALA
jgi:hypothetical protein